MKIIKFILDWSEVWALLLPLFILLVYKFSDKNVRYLKVYVIAGFILNFSAVFMLEYYYLVPNWLYVDNLANNNIFYNVHSITRVLLFSLYIIAIKQSKYTGIFKIILLTYFIYILSNYLFIESPLYLSTNTFVSESIVLLIFCMFYFFQSIQDDSQVNWLKHPSFFVCTGICFYEVTTFFIFLFFYPLSLKDQDFFKITMRIYNISFVILCIFLAFALYRSKKKVSGAMKNEFSPILQDDRMQEKPN